MRWLVLFFVMAGYWFQMAAAQGARGPDRLHVLLRSYHALPARGQFPYDETNPGLILTWDDPWRGLDASVGVFQNSFSRPSALVSVSKDWPVGDEHTLGAVLALATYREEDAIFQPLGHGLVLIPSLQMRWTNFFIQGTPLPDPDNIGVVFAYGLTFDLN